MTQRQLLWPGPAGSVYAPNIWETQVAPYQGYTPTSMAPGDMLIADYGILNVAGGNLKGDTLTIGEDTPSNPVIINLSSQAAVTVDVISLTNNVTINARGTDTLNLDSSPTTGSAAFNMATSTVNLARHAELISTDKMQFGSLTVNGSSHTSITLKGASNFAGTAVLLHTDVGGNGTISVSGNTPGYPSAPGPAIVDGLLHINGDVGRNVKVVLNSSVGHAVLTLDNPSAFDGSVALGTQSMVDLVGINADSYNIKHDILTLYQGHHVVDTLSLTNTTSAPYTIEQNASGVHMAASGMDFAQLGGRGTILPAHSF